MSTLAVSDATCDCRHLEPTLPLLVCVLQWSVFDLSEFTIVRLSVGDCGQGQFLGFTLTLSSRSSTTWPSFSHWTPDPDRNTE